MWLTKAQRLARLLKHVLQQPYNLPRYLLHLPVWGQYPMDVGLPWWSYDAIRQTRRLVNGDKSVFEFGTGGSTIFFSRLAASVVSLEDSASWQKQVEQKLKQLDIRNCEIRCSPLPTPNDDDPRWEDYLSHLNQPYDVIVVDGQDIPGFGVPGQIRSRCFYHSENYIRSGGIIIVDDSWRYEHLRSQSKARKVETYQSVGPCRIGVTSTDIYYY
jgi:predicted O-methyltransferase YrrM